MDSILFSRDRSVSSNEHAQALDAEWLETDGLGGYASGTVAGWPSRQYHGLLVAPIPGSARRFVALSRMEENLSVGERSFPLSAVRYPDGVVHPRGHEFLERFELSPYPRSIFRFGDITLERSMQMVRGSSTLVLRYMILDGEGPFQLELRPLFALRDADHLQKEGTATAPDCVRTARGMRVQAEGFPPVVLRFPPEHGFEAQPDWYHNTVYTTDQERGFEGREDHFTPGAFRFSIAPGQPTFVSLGTVAETDEPHLLFGVESRRRERLLTDARAFTRMEAATRAYLAADDFLYRDTYGRPGVLAGFPWFGEWGRDVFIALPGLTLARGRLGECAEVLHGALPFLREGLLPNIYAATAEESHYGSVDAALWFARAVVLFEQAGGSRSLVNEELLPALCEIATWYWNGTALDIRADEHGLIRAGGAGLNPTWMDAQTTEGPVTPRAGFAVEINALWLALLARVKSFLEEAERHDEAALWSERSRVANKAFLERFWSQEHGHLADVWDRGQLDTSVRPNMVLAAALEHSPLSIEQRRSIVEITRRELLTPVGLRTLAPGDVKYRGRFRGGPDERDNAYHQGTTWPWLLGFYTEAALRAWPRDARILEELTLLWDGIDAELDRAGLNHISEVFDGDPPHLPGGTMAQAWNTGEYLRAQHMLEAVRAGHETWMGALQ